MTSNKLANSFPLPEGWSPVEVVEDTIDVAGIPVRRAGVSSVGPSEVEVVGSAADVSNSEDRSESSPLERSYFELLERVVTIEALTTKRPGYVLRTEEGGVGREVPHADIFPESDDPASWRFARSNGIAIHVDWKTAASRASSELVERDHVLRAWLGASRPIRIEGLADTPLVRTRGYAWEAYAFTDGVARGQHVVGVFGFPNDASMPLALGFAARRDRTSAIRSAGREALQVLSFLWGEPAPTTVPATGPSPGHHLDYFQYPPHRMFVREWLDGSHEAFAELVRERPVADLKESVAVEFVDLTPQWLSSSLTVVKAVSAAAVPLTFGDSPFTSHLPRALRLHPVA